MRGWGRTSHWPEAPPSPPPSASSAARCSGSLRGARAISPLSSESSRGNNLKGCKDFYLKAKARIWP